MRARRFALPLAALVLVGCDRITGADQQKNLDAEAIGYACRISLKIPEDCMKENEALSPTSILTGWKEADKDIKEKTIDPSMGKHPPLVQPPQSAVAAAEPEAAAKPAEPPAAKSEKPAAAPGKPDKSAAEKKAGR